MSNADLSLQREKQAWRQKDSYPGVLGDENGNPYARLGYYWVRFPQGTDSNGQTVYGAARPVRYNANAGIIAHAGVEVLVWKHEYDGIETIKEMDPSWWARVNIDSRTSNPGEPASKWVSRLNLIEMLNRPTGSSSGSASTLVTTRENPFFFNDFQDWVRTPSTTPTNQSDLASYIPAADTHRVVITYYDVIANTRAAAASTAKALSTALDFNDFLEIRGLLPHNECLPLTAYELADNQGSININDMMDDLRNWLSMPAIIGFPNPMLDGKAWILRETHQLVTYDLVCLADFTCLGDAVFL